MKQVLYRVLSFDGGGIRGLYQSRLLESLNALGHDVAAHADVFAGTSTGAIVAAALARCIQPAKITALYAAVGEQVFPHRGKIRRAVRAVTSLVRRKPGYSSAALREALEQQLGKDTTLGECTKRLIVAAISLNQYKLKVFDSSYEADKQAKLVDVVLVSAAAPTYFQPARLGDTYYVDGGLCCNNPAFRAVTKLCLEGVDLRRIYVLSISTGALPVTKAAKQFLRLRNVRWARPAIDIAMSGSSDLAVQDGALVGYHCRVTENLDSQIALDDYRRALDILPALAATKADDIRQQVKHWIDGPAATGDSFAGPWTTSFTWGAPKQTAQDKLNVLQCGDAVYGETVSRSGQWEYSFSATVHGNVLIGEWKGAALQGSFLLIKSKESGKADGHWIGTGDHGAYFGEWSWMSGHE